MNVPLTDGSPLAKQTRLRSGVGCWWCGVGAPCASQSMTLTVALDVSSSDGQIIRAKSIGDGGHSGPFLRLLVGFSGVVSPCQATALATVG